MALLFIQASHIRVVCDACGTASAELCGKREFAITARANAVHKFRAHGWHHDPTDRGRQRAVETAEREGSGRWYCPACARATHL